MLAPVVMPVDMFGSELVEVVARGDRPGTAGSRGRVDSRDAEQEQRGQQSGSDEAATRPHPMSPFAEVTQRLLSRAYRDRLRAGPGWQYRDPSDLPLLHSQAAINARARRANNVHGSARDLGIFRYGPLRIRLWRCMSHVAGIATLAVTKSLFNVSRRHATVDRHRHPFSRGNRMGGGSGIDATRRGSRARRGPVCGLRPHRVLI